MRWDERLCGFSLQTLLAAGADKSAVSAAGKTACDYAEDSDHHVITEALTSCDVIVD